MDFVFFKLRQYLGSIYIVHPHLSFEIIENQGLMMILYFDQAFPYQ
jgi:hypothetical protein